MRFALALSGGGIRGVAHIGVLKALEEGGLYPSMISGTSAGAIVAGLYAYGYSTSEIETIALDLQPKYIDINYWEIAFSALQWAMGMEPSIDGLVKGKTIEKYLKKATRDTKIHEIKMPLAITSVDINRGKSIIFTNMNLDTLKDVGDKNIDYILDIPLYKAIRASIAIPVIFKPVIIGGRRMVDGGVTDNLPIGVLKTMGAKKIIGVDLGYNGKLRGEVDNIIEIGSQSLDTMAYQITSLKSHGADYIIRPEIYDVAINDSQRVAECIQRGYEKTKENINIIKKSIISNPSTPLFYRI